MPLKRAQTAPAMIEESPARRRKVVAESPARPRTLQLVEESPYVVTIYQFGFESLSSRKSLESKKFPVKMFGVGKVWSRNVFDLKKFGVYGTKRTHEISGEFNSVGVLSCGNDPEVNFVPIWQQTSVHSYNSQQPTAWPLR